MTNAGRHGWKAPWFSPVRGAAVGAVGGLLYWGAAEIWPTSIAVAIAMLAMVLLDPPDSADAGRVLRWSEAGLILGILLRYNVFMALSAANLPYSLPQNAALGFIMVAGQSLGSALAISVPMPAANSRTPSVSTLDLAIALVLGFTPAALIGIPGLIGIAAALMARFGWSALERRWKEPASRGGDGAPAGYGDSRAKAAGGHVRCAREVAEISFYLGALGAWSFI